MIKKFFALAITVLTLNVASAQRDSAYVEVGINAMRLVTLGQTPQQPDLWNPYLFTLEGGVKNFGVRMGASMANYTYAKLPVPVVGNTREDNDSSRTDFRVGIFYSYNPDEKWSFKFGVDYFSSKTETLSRTEFKEHTTEKLIIDEFTVNRKESGVAPFINAQYHITPRVSVGTELLWRIGTFTQNELDTNTNSPVDIERKYEGKRSFFLPPTALFLSVRF